MQHIRQDLHKRNQQILAEHIGRIDQRPALVRQNGFHIPGGDDGLRDGQQQQDVAADAADGTPFFLTGLLLFGQAGKIARGHVTATQAIPETAYRVGTPGIREHRGARGFRHGLKLGTPFVIANQLAFGQ